jgi:23S rRNA pseudouridine2605 synthase
MTRERLQKILAAAGLGSRRSCEQMIEEGRVEVNGLRAQLGSSADPDADRIRVDGAPLPVRPKPRTFAIHKPRGIVSSLAAQGERATVRDLLPFSGRFYPVGRLDMDSEGLILLTNDGDLAQRISHPSFEVEKEYMVLIARRPTEEQLAIWRRGVVLEDGFRTASMAVKFESTFGRGAWVRVTMHEGRKHELRDIGRTIGLPVVRIIRQRIGSFTLGDLKPGAYRELTEKETGELQALPGIQKKDWSGKASPRGKPGFREKAAESFQAFPEKQKKVGYGKAVPGGKSGFREKATESLPAFPKKWKKAGYGKASPRGKPGFREKATESLPAFPKKWKKAGYGKTAPGGKPGFREKETESHKAFPKNTKKAGYGKASPGGKPGFREKETGELRVRPGKQKKGGFGKAAPDGKPGFRSVKRKIRRG